LKKYLYALADKAFQDKNSRGRAEKPDGLSLEDELSPFFLDAGAIMNSKAFRRLRDKAQVFLLPDQCHVRTRMIHTLEVADAAVKIARLLGLNADLCQAIALGHDIGHTPYGHKGETFISKVTGKNFDHQIFSAVVAQRIERKGNGLNLAAETLQGIMNHSRSMDSLAVDDHLPQEYAVVMLSDKICYSFSDFNDALRYGYLDKKDTGIFLAMGGNQRERMETCLEALIRESAEAGRISFFASSTAKMFQYLRKWMMENVYQATENGLNEQVLAMIYEYFRHEPFFAGCDPAILLALLTDKEANCMAELFLKSRKPEIEHIKHFGIMEIYEQLRRQPIVWWEKPEF
jgi:dGTPase